MPQQKERKYNAATDGRLNSDDAAFAIGINEWVNSENIRSGTTDAGETAVIESIGSTILLSTPQPSVVFQTIGKGIDYDNNRIIKFQFDTTGRNDRIMCYDENVGIEYVVLLSSQVSGGLNFSNQSIIHSVRIINGLLYWVEDVTNQPRKINIDAAIRANVIAGNNPPFIPYQKNVVPYTLPLNFSEITIIKPTSIFAPSATKFTDGSFLANLIFNNSFQFAFQYIYYDNETTVIGEYSLYTGVNFASSTFNAIRVLMDFNEKIPSTVRIVNLIVRTQDGTVTGGNNANVVKTWDKEISSESLEILNQNLGLGQLTFVFYNNITGEAIPVADVLRPFDNVPIYSESLEFAKQRLFPSNNTEGYDTPKQTSLIIGTQSVLAIPPQQVLMDGATFKGGMVFLDFGMRRCGVVTSSTSIVSTPLFQDNPFAVGNIPAFITWSVNNLNTLNEIPDWAYYYMPVRTLNLKTRFFIESISVKTAYATKDANGNYVYTNTTFPSNCAGIALNTVPLIESGLGYVFNAGDQCVLKLYDTGFNPLGFQELPVIAQDGNYIIVQAKDIGNLANLYVGYQIYTPYQSSINEPFYDMGQVYKINNPTTSIRSYSTLNGAMQGDIWISLRNTNQIPSAYVVLSMCINDSFYKRWDSSISKTNFITKLGQVKKTQYVSWSDTFIPNTAFNGLSTFRIGNEISVSQDCGVINKLQLAEKVSDPKEDTIMVAVCSNAAVSMYLGQTKITDATGVTQFLGTATDVISTINILQGNYGTINPESVVQYRGRIFWYDAINGRIIQYASNGLFPISNYKMTRFWNLWSLQYRSMTKAQIEALGAKPFVFTEVDPLHDEVLFSIPKLSNMPPKGYLPDYPSTIYPFDILDFQGKCLGKGTKVLMFDFSLKKVEDIKIGDILMGYNGVPRKVLSTTNGIEQMYWVRQKKGIDYRVNESHILSVKVAKYDYKKSQKIQKYERENVSVKTFLSKKSSWKKSTMGHKSGCLYFDKNHVNIDPYYLGLWLGDGTAKDLSITNTDKEIAEYLYEFVKNKGGRIRISGGITYHLVGIKNVLSEMVKYGLVYDKRYNRFGEKHIPFNYLHNTESIRLEVLAGLLDSDGSLLAEKNGYEITQKREKLAMGIATLARSLGFYVNINSPIATMKRGDGTIYKSKVYRLHIRGDVERIPLKINRKKATAKKIRNVLHTGIKIEKDIVDEYYGFTLDGDGLFLLEDFTVTHNTMVFKLEREGQPPHWQGSYSFNPEMFASLNNKLYAFNNGLTFRHNETSSQNNFYGIQYKSKIMLIANMQPNLPKVYENIYIECNMLSDFVYFYNSEPQQQSSDLVDISFTPLEGVDYAVILRNKLIPTAIGMNTNGLMTGEKMRNTAMYVLVQFTPVSKPLALKYITIGYEASRGNRV